MFRNTCWDGFAEGKAVLASLRQGWTLDLGNLIKLGLGKALDPLRPLLATGPNG